MLSPLSALAGGDVLVGAERVRGDWRGLPNHHVQIAAIERPLYELLGCDPAHGITVRQALEKARDELVVDDLHPSVAIAFMWRGHAFIIKIYARDPSNELHLSSRRT